MDLGEARARIDETDAAMAALFRQRMEAVRAVAAYKAAHGLPVTDPAREAEKLAKIASEPGDPALRPYALRFLRGLMELSKDYQRALRPEPAEGTARRVPVELGARRYEARIGPGLLARAGALLDLDRRVLIVTDAGVPAAYAQIVAAQCREAQTVTLPRGEASKSLDRLGELLRTMLDRGFDRGDAVCAVGGGMVGDLAGLAAALYQRGIDFYNLPTTVLSQVDSSVGGKTAVNLGGVKNAAGTFYQPRAVLMDTDTLKSLPRRAWASGLAEAVKMGMIGDADLFARLERGAAEAEIGEIIAAAVAQKAAVVAADEREAGLRRCLNFGHTLGHGIEAAARGSLTHGECVALGMLPMCAPETRERLRRALERLGLPIRCQVDPEAAFAAIVHDKKSRNGVISTVWVEEPGRYELRDCPPQALRERLEQVVSA